MIHGRTKVALKILEKTKRLSLERNNKLVYEWSIHCEKVLFYLIKNCFKNWNINEELFLFILYQFFRFGGILLVQFMPICGSNAVQNHLYAGKMLMKLTL